MSEYAQLHTSTYYYLLMLYCYLRNTLRLGHKCSSTSVQWRTASRSSTSPKFLTPIHPCSESTSTTSLERLDPKFGLWRRSRSGMTEFTVR
jgi:hypothetical protein